MPDIEIKEEEIEVIEVFEYPNKFDIHINSRCNKQEAEQLKKQILADQKLRQLVERAIKILEDDIANWEPTTPSLIRDKREKQVRIRLLQSLIDESKGVSND